MYLHYFLLNLYSTLVCTLSLKLPLIYTWVFHLQKVLQSYIISKALDFSPLLGSNKSRTARIRTLINTGFFGCIGSYAHKKTSGNSNNKSEYFRYNPTMSTYSISRDLEIPPIAGTCAVLQVKCFVKWRKSNYIIKDLIKFILILSHHSSTKEENLCKMQTEGPLDD